MRRKKILITLIAIAVALTLYLALSSKKLEPQANDSNQINSQNISADYKLQAAQIVGDFYSALSNNNTTLDQISLYKSKLLALTVPAEYKDLHVQLVMALEKMENYIGSNDEREWSASIEIINNAMAANPWLRK